MNDIEKALTVSRGMTSRDSALATKYLDPDRYVEHNPNSRDSVEGVKHYVEQIASGDPDLRVVRSYQDGSYVFMHADGHVLGDGNFFDVFRVDDGLIVEHWGFSTKAAPPNKSGHTQLDGRTEPKYDANTGKNKAIVREYYQAVHIGGRHDVIPQYFAGDYCVRHEPGVADAVGEFMRDLEVLTQNRTIDEIKLLLGQGDFVFITAKGTHQDEPCAYVDLYRAEDDKIVERWGDRRTTMAWSEAGFAVRTGTPQAHPGIFANGMRHLSAKSSAATRTLEAGADHPLTPPGNPGRVKMQIANHVSGTAHLSLDVKMLTVALRPTPRFTCDGYILVRSREPPESVTGKAACLSVAQDGAS